MRLTSLTPDMLTHITPRGISALPGPVGEPTLLAPVDEKMRLTSLTPDMLTHITPRGISALPGPVGEPTLLAPVDEKNETYVFLTPDMLTHIKRLILLCRL